MAASGLGWVLDTLLYLLLVWLGARVFFAALLGNLSGAAFAFVTSHRFIFAGHGRLPVSKLLVYLVYTVGLMLLSAWAIEHVVQGLYIASDRMAVSAPQTIVAFLAKCIVTPLTLIANFLVARFLLDVEPPAAHD